MKILLMVLLVVSGAAFADATLDSINALIWDHAVQVDQRAFPAAQCSANPARWAAQDAQYATQLAKLQALEASPTPSPSPSSP